MRHHFLAWIALSLFAGAAQADFLCNYTARISEQDKRNSSGGYLTNGTTVSTAIAAAIIRQDRANYHQFDKRDPEDTNDCYFHDKDNRAALEKRLGKGTAPKESLKQIIFGNPLISVDVYDDFVNVKILDASNSSTRSSKSSIE
ncbi:MAG: hypothetical protein RLZZ262_1823 [Bacteroidota bacterium]|jgi:hypothetical protein